MRDYNQNRSTGGINVLYYSVQSNCYNLLKEININNFNLEKEFESNGKITRVYVRK